MIKLNQNLDNLTFHQGWYGICAETEEECADFNLISGTGASAVKLYSQIHAIYEIRSDSFGQLSYNGSIENGEALDYQQIKTLECGHSYIIILKKGDGFLEIENFVSANSESVNYRIVSSCEVEDDSTPTPERTPTPETTPTPEQTPTPEILKSWIQLGSDIDGEASGDYSGDSVSLSADGKIVEIGAGGNDGNGYERGHTRS